MELDFNRICYTTIKDRKSKVTINEFAKRIPKEKAFNELLFALPNILQGKELKDFIKVMRNLHYQNKPFLWMMGAHTIKVGLTPIFSQLMEQGYIKALALNGAGAIHDAEIALFGETSEDVADLLPQGKFGVTKETMDFFYETFILAHKQKIGLGEIIPQKLLDSPYAEYSLLAASAKNNIPVTIHIAIGCDIIHQDPRFTGEEIGGATFRDFQRLVRIISQVLAGGMVLNIGSAVQLPEVFLKALNLARNLSGRKGAFYTTVFDMFTTYRARENVLIRPTEGNKDKYFSFLGHHELIIPLLLAILLSEE